MSRWLSELSEEDTQFIKRFLLCSGSLKEMASQYGVTYPTIRLRMDRLIEKIRVLDNQGISDEYERLLRAKMADGRLDASTFEALLSAYRAHSKNFK
ncbi:MAG: DUF2089 family protein [Deltaproteobacteria bacterium]|nr:DUF2089 family protein [Deltaproteobacteria bacterium]